MALEPNAINFILWKVVVDNRGNFVPVALSTIAYEFSINANPRVPFDYNQVTIGFTIYVNWLNDSATSFYRTLLGC